MCLCAHFIIGYYDGSMLEEEFNYLCKRLFKLLIKYVVPIDIQIDIENVQQSKFSEYRKVFLSHFQKEKVLNQYRQPNCNKYCHPLKKPNIVCKYYDVSQQDIFDSTVMIHVSNATHFN